MKDSLEVYCDGGARGNPGPGASAFVVFAEGRVLKKESFYLGVTTNNKAEYNAVLLAFNWLVKDSSNLDKKISFFVDSELIANQLSGSYKTKNSDLKNLLLKVKKLESRFKTKIVYKAVSRSKNKLADFLVNRQLDKMSKKISRT